MGMEELLQVLNRINEEREIPIDKTIIEQILALVIMHPLDGDRGVCQAQISELISQRTGAKK